MLNSMRLANAVIPTLALAATPSLLLASTSLGEESTAAISAPALPASAAAAGSGAEPTAPESPTLESPKLPRRFGERGDTRVNFLLGVASDFDGTEVAQGGVGVSWFVVDSLSIDLELLGVGVFQDEEDAGGAALNLLFRWHFWENEARTISLYADAGVGLAGFSEDVPAGGSEFNFTPQIGVGASFELGPRTRLMTGVRWLHFSNAQLSSGNPGLDTALLYAGISIGF